MKNILSYALLFVTVSFFVACSNGEYVANPSSNSNGSINPLDPLKKEDFNWTGTDPFSVEINGTKWVPTSTTWYLDSGRNVILATDGAKVVELFLKDVYANNLYSMGYQQFNTMGVYTDSFGSIDFSKYYQSVYGNSGGVWIVRNDSAVIKGLFYFQAVNYNSKVNNFTHGYFNISKI